MLRRYEHQVILNRLDLGVEWRQLHSHLQGTLLQGKTASKSMWRLEMELQHAHLLFKGFLLSPNLTLHNKTILSRQAKFK